LLKPWADEIAQGRCIEEDLDQNHRKYENLKTEQRKERLQKKWKRECQR
jgi:hypothetical protein